MDINYRLGGGKLTFNSEIILCAQLEIHDFFKITCQGLFCILGDTGEE